MVALADMAPGERAHVERLPDSPAERAVLCQLQRDGLVPGITVTIVGWTGASLTVRTWRGEVDVPRRLAGRIGAMRGDPAELADQLRSPSSPPTVPPLTTAAHKGPKACRT